MRKVAVAILYMLVTFFFLPPLSAEPVKEGYSFRLTITSDLPFPNTPMDVLIDFNTLIEEAGLPGVLDPNSIIVVDVKTGEAIPHARTEDFAYGDKGRIEWVIKDPTHKEYEIRFRTAERRPPLAPAKRTPLIGVGDLLRYNAGVPRPIAPIYLSRLVDLNGDDRRDLVGCWNYAYRPGSPWDGIICFHRVGDTDKFEFGDLTRIRYVDKLGSTDFRHFTKTYMHADFADLDGDGLVDLVYSPSGGNSIYLFRNSGRRDAGGMPIFVAEGSVSRQTATWGPCRAVDLDGDGAVDFVIGATYLRNTNPNGWPIKLAKSVKLDAGRDPCFYDVDGDGALDAVCLENMPTEDPLMWRENVGVIPDSPPTLAPRAFQVAWRKNLGGNPPRFDRPKVLTDIDAWFCTYLAAVNDGPRKGLLVLHNGRQVVSFYEQTVSSNGRPGFRRFGRALSCSAVLALDDQAWPWVCDWDADGDLDLLVGGGYGWPRILINDGSNERPAFSEPQFILSEGKPIRILRDEVFASRHWHNMGYPYPAFVDWDADGLPDLLIPNETNRIFWYKNIGTRRQPRFGKRLQVICDGYPDSPAKRAKSARLAGDKKTPNQPYPYEKDQPFFWRTGAGFGDWNGDGLMDLVTHDGFTRKLTLFVQYRDEKGDRRLKRDRALEMADGRLIDDSVVGRRKHWTESFKCVDWDRDGLLDIIYSCAGTEPAKGSIYLLRNCGAETTPRFENPVTLSCFGAPIHVTSHGPHPWVGDLDGDGTPDIVACVEWSVYPFYRHAAIEMKERPKFRIGAVERR